MSRGARRWLAQELPEGFAEIRIILRVQWTWVVLASPITPTEHCDVRHGVHFARMQRPGPEACSESRVCASEQPGRRPTDDRATGIRWDGRWQGGWRQWRARLNATWHLSGEMGCSPLPTVPTYLLGETCGYSAPGGYLLVRHEALALAAAFSRSEEYPSIAWSRCLSVISQRNDTPLNSTYQPLRCQT